MYTDSHGKREKRQTDIVRDREMQRPTAMDKGRRDRLTWLETEKCRDSFFQGEKRHIDIRKARENQGGSLRD